MQGMRPRDPRVMTYMRGDVVRGRAPISITSSTGQLEFEATVDASGRYVDVFVASIGRRHRECIVDVEALRHTFADHGLAFRCSATFEELAALVPNRPYLSEAEETFSSLYAAAIFEKQATTSKVMAFEKQALRHLVKFATFDSIGRLRRVCSTWRRNIDDMNGRDANKVLQDQDIEDDDYDGLEGFIGNLPPPALGTLLRIAGLTTRQITETELASFATYAAEARTLAYSSDYDDGPYDSYEDYRIGDY